MLAGVARGQTGYSITGGMSNFDCGNHTDEPCDEFETEIEGCRPEDVVHTYSNSNYGAPSVTLSADGLATIVDYRNPQHPTAVGSIEHYGITLRQLSSAYNIRVRWMHNGHTATVNGQIPVQGGGSAPATQPMLPSISTDMGVGSTGGDGVNCTVTNNDPVQWIWVQRRSQVSQGSVTLESLMTNDPVVTSTELIDPAPVLLAPGQSLSQTSDLIEIETEDHQSAVFAAEYFQDLGNIGPFSSNHSRGPSLGNVMTATLTGPTPTCQASAPIIETQPHSVNAAEGHEVALQVSVEGNGFPVTYHWTKDGQDLTNGNGISGATGDELTINSLTSAFEGFYSVRVSNQCGESVSDSALVFITGHNIAPQHPCDPAASAPIMSQSVCFGGLASFVAVATGSAPVTYRWQIQSDVDVWSDLTLDGVVLGCGGVAYADTPDALTTNVAVVPCPGMSEYPIRCVVSNSCGTSNGTAGSLFVFAGQPGDMNNDGWVDGLDIQPFVDFLQTGTAAGAGICAADVNVDGIADAGDVLPLVDILLN